MLRIGHRGAKGHVSENTIESFLKAFELGAHGVELDVHLTLDNEAIVIHDETVDRTIRTAAGFVNDFTVEEFAKLGIPTLVEVFHILPDNAFLNIEIKDAKVTKIVVDEVEKFVRLNEIQYPNVLISSFNWEVLQEVKQLNPKIQLGILEEENIKKALDFAKKTKGYSINPYFKLLTQEIIEESHKNNIKVHTWTVNSPDDILWVKELGVDAIISDFPDRL